MTTVDRRAVQEMLEGIYTPELYSERAIDAAIKALANLPSSNAQAVAWQPIETAPRDRTEVIVGWNDGGVDHGHWSGEGWTDDDRGDWPHGPEWWMPLPPLPTGDAKEA